MSFVSVLKPEGSGSYISSYLLGKFAEEIPGGLAEGKPDSKYPKTQLRMGTKVEKEHTGDKAKAKEIAKDHLEEDKKYYTKLKKIEGGSHKTATVYILKGFEKRAFEMEKEARFGAFLRAAGGAVARGARNAATAGARFARNRLAPAIQRGAQQAAQYARGTVLPAAARGVSNVQQYVRNQVVPRVQRGAQQATQFVKARVSPAVQAQAQRAGQYIGQQARAGGEKVRSYVQNTVAPRMRAAGQQVKARAQQAQDYARTTGIPKAREAGTKVKQYAQRLWKEQINPTRGQQILNKVKGAFQPEGVVDRVSRGAKKRFQEFSKARAEGKIQKRIDKEVGRRLAEQKGPTTAAAEAPQGAVGKWWAGLSPTQKAMTAAGGGVGAGMLLSGGRGSSDRSRPPTYAY